jgi:hypothetical protein
MINEKNFNCDGVKKNNKNINNFISVYVNLKK